MTFGLYGALFVLTQFMQFFLGYTPLQAGIRVLPAAAALVVVALPSARLVRVIGTKLTMAAGLALIAAGLWQISGATVTTTFAGTVLGMVLLGAGAGLAIPTATGSVIGSVPDTDSGVASATNTTAIQFGGALGVAVVGSLLDTRYQDKMTSALAGQHLPHAVMATVTNSLGGALTVATRAGGASRHPAHPPGQGGVRQRHGPRPAHRVRGRYRGLPAGSGLAACSPGRRARIRAPIWKASATPMTAGVRTSRTPGTQLAAMLLPVIPPTAPSRTAPTAGQMTSPARLGAR